MDLDLKERQIQILKAIVEEYTATAEPVGSETLEKKHALHISPATIRNEMARLTRAGLLTQPHTSAGRIPSPLGLKLYIKNLMQEKELSVSEEIDIKESIWDYRFQADKLLKQAVKTLAEQTHALSIAATQQGDVFHSGYANILDMPEFYDIDLTKNILSILDQSSFILELFSKGQSNDPIQLLIGSDLGYDYLEPCSIIYKKFKSPKLSGSLGVIGPTRLYYSQIIPILRYLGNLVQELINKC